VDRKSVGRKSVSDALRYSIEGYNQGACGLKKVSGQTLAIGASICLPLFDSFSVPTFFESAAAARRRDRHFRYGNCGRLRRRGSLDPAGCFAG
jgi:hypothetical protein